MRLEPSFFQHDDVVLISKQLLGKEIYTEIDGTTTGGVIVETEAYRAPDDRACHAYANRLTPRTKTMFERGGTLYVYISYGIHRMINVVTSSKGKAHAVLVRAVQPLIGFEAMATRRNHEELRIETMNGPGKSAKALGVQILHDGLNLCDPSSPIWIEDQGRIVEEKDIVVGPRVGMSIHTGPDAHRPWRFYVKDNKWVSRPKIVKYPNIPR